MLIFVDTASMDLYKETLAQFNARKFINAEKLIPTYICSIGAHIFNLENKKRSIYTESGLIPDMRLHVFMVTIPGFGKTFLLNQMMSRQVGLLADTDIRTRKIAEMSAAGLVGTIKSTQDGNVMVHFGLLHKYADAILGSEEFSVITTASKQGHSSTLNMVLLSALDSGEVIKDLSGKGLDYFTFSTLWAAVQPARYDLGDGFHRRFLFMVYMPSIEDIRTLRFARENSKNLVIDIKRLLEYKKAIKERVKEVHENLKNIIFAPSFYTWLHTKHIMHYEDILYERMLLGYWIMKSEIVGEELYLELNDEIKGIIDQQIKYRLEVQKGVEKIKIWEIIKFYKEVSLEELIKMLLSFSLAYDYINKSLIALEKLGDIKIDNGIVYNLRYEVRKE